MAIFVVALVFGERKIKNKNMQAVLTLSEAGEMDRRLIERYGLSSSALIDNAAKGAFEIIKWRVSGRVVVMAGPGNNGSDGIELARLLHAAGHDVSMLYPYERGNEENLSRRRNLPSGMAVVSSPSGFDTVIDALFGFSYRKGNDTILQDIENEIGEDALRIALDVPSGGIIRADITVSFMAPKLELYLPSVRGMAGEIHIFNPGFPEDELKESPERVYLLSDDDSEIRKIGVSDYKNTRGHLLIIGGSDEYTGAPRLSGRAAFAAGCGLVTVMTDSEKIRDENPSFMIRKPGSDLSRYDSVLAGPGWGDGNSDLFESAFLSGKPLVIDADALKFVPGHVFGNRAVLTPHIGEYKRLMKAMGMDDGLTSATELESALRKLSRTLSAVIVLKSSTVWITDGDDIYIYDGANPSLGVAGSGDVLAGVTATLMAGGEDPLRAAVDGVILHQKAGRNAHIEYGYYPADELIKEVGRAR